MRDNPISFFLQSLVGQIQDQKGLSTPTLTIELALWWAIILGGLGIAVYIWRSDASQRSLNNVIILGCRMVAGAMWYLGTLWKLPLPVSDGFKFWMDSTVKFSSFQFHADIMQVFTDHIAVVQPLVFLLETFFAFSLMFGFMVRVSSLLAALFTFNLLIGLYNDPTEWAWTYIAIIYGHVMFFATQSGRSLGLDYLIAQGRLVRPGTETLTRRIRWAT
jgi:uncharacterized membrane protein YphA (DoxX/SURF4 family)